VGVQLETNTKRFRGLSTDLKPGHETEAKPPVGSVFTETDTGERYIWTGSWPWVRQEQTIEGLLNELIEVNQQILNVLSATHRGHEEYLWEENVEPE
jgi:hypothetical protein